MKLKSFLKQTLIGVFLLFNLTYGQNPFEGLVLEQLNNNDVVSGTTYRLYAQLSEGKLYAIYADEANPSLLQTSTSFFNSSYSRIFNFINSIVSLDLFAIPLGVKR